MNLSKRKVKTFNTVIIGAGAAGLNCAVHLVEEGIPSNEICIITKKLGSGTSFNTGSDKQTYYKLSIIGDQNDSPIKMAEDYYKGGCMHGDIALVEATNSVREFFHLVDLNVPFPQDKFGGYVGYKTDNDPRQRATSIGPYTSQKMGKCLLKEVRKKKISIIDDHFVFKILTHKSEKSSRVLGILAFDKKTLLNNLESENLLNSVKIYRAENVILATGGPAQLYKYSVYPKSQKGSTFLAIEIGCELQNLTESQFGLASQELRWNLSGSYQQVLPRYISIDENNVEHEFLYDYFPDFQTLSKAIFLKGYQWPFNAERIESYGSSLIDLAVYYEMNTLGREVYLDYKKNPKRFSIDKLDDEVHNYLKKSDALRETPVQRLKNLNEDAYILYKKNGIDLAVNYLNIAVCNQHVNGGIVGDIWWETNIKNLFAIGEINGSHGIHRPGGAALNSGQVGGLRAAQKISHKNQPSELEDFKIFKIVLEEELENLKVEINHLMNDSIVKIPLDKHSKELKERMNKFGTIIRPFNGLKIAIEEIETSYINFPKKTSIKSNNEIVNYFQTKGSLLMQLIIFNSFLHYHKRNGRSRGSYLITRHELGTSFSERFLKLPGNLLDFKFITNQNDLSNQILVLKLNVDEFREKESKLIFNVEWQDVREIPQTKSWFETTWKRFKNGSIYE
ncbi:MAG: FAD-binding protein [Candidatus Lokiarchaeota archaeon]|nr:FAD-binding protein [Candidatus Lokiarchaeota archaeon]MBD3201699.1 FAD-binding protein [Candidatus Lokiarchaeota archaeon]